MTSPLLAASGLLIVATACASAARAPPAAAAPAGPEVLGVFEGTTPCGPLTLPPITGMARCEMAIWRVVLRRDPASGGPTTFSLEAAVGLPEQGTPGIAGGGTPVSWEGTWVVLKGTPADAEAVVYRLDPRGPRPSVSFRKMGASLLHLLDRDGALQVGNGAWSYTLSRTDDRPPLDPAERAGAPPDSLVRPPIPPPPAGARTVGVFEGRTPCHALAVVLTDGPVYPGCVKVKMRLSLYLHPGAGKDPGSAGTYLLVGTHSIARGTWTLARGNGKEPGAVVYRLDPEQGGRPGYFLKGDENHLLMLDGDREPLVGNAHFSFTLSRAERAAR